MPMILRILGSLLAASLSLSATEIHLAQGVMAGEVTAHSAILQTRLTSSPALKSGDVPGASGVGRFEISTRESFENSRYTAWIQATPERDFIMKARVADLQPVTRYFYRVHYGSDAKRASVGTVAQFSTLPDATAASRVSFILTSCMNYAYFHEGYRERLAYAGADRQLGYPALEAVLRLQPDFCIFDGDCVYYDAPAPTRAQTLPELRRKWHEQYVQERFVRLFARVPGYWLKDDHDHRKNDSDATGDYAPSHELGIATFREQVPVTDPNDPRAVTYRTHRMGRDLQLWFVEGRDYRSPNRLPDGPGKSIWGGEQRAWLQRTLAASDATFKILVSPTPLIGPDDASKLDNHVNPRGFRHEGESFLAWLRRSGIPPGRFYIICGDRHWKYHSMHATGFEELSSGALNTENSRMGRAPGDAESTDPDRLVQQLYTDAAPSGGFLRVAVEPAGGGRAPRIEFTHHDDRGGVRHRHSYMVP